jgi:F-type H+-transporting ATPase subunit c
MVNRNTKLFLMLAIGFVVFAFGGVAFAQDGMMTTEIAQAQTWSWIAIAAALVLSLAAFGGALGMGKAAAHFFDGVSRNPGAGDKMFVPLVIALALIEALSIYALIIAFLLQGNIGA